MTDGDRDDERPSTEGPGSSIWPLLAIAIVALAVRGLAVALVPTEPVSDFASYWTRAANLIETGVYGVRPGRPDATWPPGWTLWLTLAGGRLAVAKGLNVVLGLVTVGLVGRLGSRLAGRRAGLAAAWMAALHPTLVLLPCLLASENLFIPLVLGWAALVLGSGWRRRGPVAGLVLGFAYLVRPAALVLVPVWVGWCWLVARRSGERRWWAPVGAGVVVFALVLVPWAWRNGRSMDRFSPFTTSSGGTLFLGNNPEATGVFYPADDQVREILLGHGRPQGFERNDLFRRLAMEWMAEEPGTAARLYVAKLGRIVGVGDWVVTLAVGHPEGPVPVTHVVSRHRTRLAAVVSCAHWLTLGLVVVGGGRLCRVGPCRGVGLLVGSAGALVLFGALFLGNPRFAWPAIALLLSLAGGASPKDQRQPAPYDPPRRSLAGRPACRDLNQSSLRSKTKV